MIFKILALSLFWTYAAVAATTVTADQIKSSDATKLWTMPATSGTLVNSSVFSGTTLQYIRGDGSAATLDSSVVPENTNLYYTNARGIGSTLTGYSAGAGIVAATDSVLQAIQKLDGNISALPSAWTLAGNTGTGGTAKIGTTDAQNFDIIAGNSTVATVVESYKGISAAPTVVPADATGVNQFDWRTYVSPTASTNAASHTTQYNQLVWDNPNAGFNNVNGSLAAVSNNFSMNGSGTINYASANTNSGNFNNGVTTQYKGVTSENGIATGATVTDYYGMVSGLNTTSGILGTHTGISQYGGFTDATFSAQSTGIANSDAFSGTTTLGQGATGVNSFLQFNDTTAITNQINGFSSGIDLNDDVVANGVNGYNVYVNNRNNASSGGINLNAISLNQTDAATSNGVNGYNANLQFSGTSSTTGVSIANLYARTFDTAHLDGLNAINSNPEIEGSSTIDNVTLLSIGGQIRGNSTVTNLSGGYISPQMSGSATATNFTGLTVGPQVNGSATLTNGLTGINVNPQGSVALNGATGVSIDMSGVSLAPAYLAAGGQKKAISVNDGALEMGYNYTIPGASGFFQNHYLGGSAIVANGDPVSAFGFGTNLAQQVQLHDNWTLDGAGLGYVDVGFVGSMNFDAGTTMARWTGALGGAGNPGGSGTLTDAIMFRAAGILPQGGSLTVDNMYGFQVDPNLYGILGTNVWGFYEDTAVAENHLSKLAIGTASKKVSNSSVALEIGNSKGFVNGSGTTATKNALTAVAGMQFYDTTLSQLQVYDGATWVSAGGYTPPTEIQEVPTGVIDGVNDTYTLSQTPTGAASVKIYLDGLFQRQGTDYTIAGSTITMTTAPASGQTLDANYDY